jgi:transglutaminase-like putative cysteine protease
MKTLPAALLVCALASTTVLRAQDGGPMPYSEADVPAELRGLIVPAVSPVGPDDRANRIEYLLRIDGDPAWHLPVTDEQLIRRSEHGVMVAVCAGCRGGEAPPSLGALRQATLPTPWLQSDDAALVEFARRARGAGARRKMESLTKLVRARITQPLSYQHELNAADAFARRAGDSTEFALVLAALGRARGISTRIAAGLVYESRFAGSVAAFAPHTWVQAWTGERWESFDAALAGFDSTHLALAVGDGSPAFHARVRDAIKRLQLIEMDVFGPIVVISSPPR